MLYRARSSGEISVGQIEARNNLHCPGTKYVILLEHLMVQCISLYHERLIRNRSDWKITVVSSGLKVCDVQPYIDCS